MGVSKYSTAPALTPRQVPSRNVFGIRIRTGSGFNCARDQVQDRGQKWSREETVKKCYVLKIRMFFQDRFWLLRSLFYDRKKFEILNHKHLGLDPELSIKLGSGSGMIFP